MRQTMTADPRADELSNTFHHFGVLAKFEAIYQNARLAGATLIKVTTEARDNGGTTIHVADNGAGAASAEVFRRPGRPGWKLPESSPERPHGDSLAEAFRRTGFTVSCRPAPDAEPWNAVIEPSEAATGNRIPRNNAPEAGGIGPTGTTITFGAGFDPEAARRHAHRAARYMTMPVEVDGRPAGRTAFMESPAYVEDWNGARLGVYPPGTRPGRPGDICIAGLTMHGQLPAGSTGDGTWVVHAEARTAMKGLRRTDPSRTPLEKTPEADALRDAAARALYRGMAKLGTPGGVHTVSLTHARELGVELPERPGTLRRWRPTPADPGTPPRGRAARTAIDPAGLNLLVRTIPENGRIADAMISRALAVNDLAERAFEPDDGFAGQAWYDRMPIANNVEWKATIRNGREVADAEAATLQFRAEDLKLELELRAAGGTPVTTLATDLAIEAPDGDIKSAAVLVSKPTTLGVDELTDLLTDAFFLTDDREHADEERNELRVIAEHRAATVIEGRRQADLRQLMRLIENEVLPRLSRPITDHEELRWSLHHDEMHAEIVDRKSGETARRAMGVQPVRANG